MRSAFSLLLVGALASVAGAATNVSGPITANATWYKANQPYHVTDVITVQPGVTLTIEPGVDVLFDADVQFIVQGRLQAVGIAGDSVRFIKGVAPEWGGIRISGGDTSTIAYARISGGNADGSGIDSYGGGACLYGSSTRVLLAHVVISGNSAHVHGGGLSVNTNTTVTLTNCMITGNTTTIDGPGAGGGLSGIECQITVNSSTISNNSTSDNGGGGIYLDHAIATFTGCSIEDNVGRGGGGGLWMGCSSVTLNGCTVTGNTAYAGGGLVVMGYVGGCPATAMLNKCTVVGNTATDLSADYQGGGVYVSYSATVTVVNSIVWANLPQGIRNRPAIPGIVTVSYSDNQDGWSGTGNINADPLFVNAAAGDYHLMAGSPCRGTGEGSVDMGAFPWQTPPPGTPVSGPITANTTWSKINQPYRVTGTVTVNTGVTLTIQPGVDVLFDADVQFVVQGALHAVGAPSDSIRFLKGTAAEWGGISISEGDSSTIAYGRVSHGNAWQGGGISLWGSGTRLGLVHAVISGNAAGQGGGGVFNGMEAALTMANCTVVGNYDEYYGGGLANMGTLTMTNCTISGNTASQMDGGAMYSTGSATLTDCIISGNSAAWGGGLRNCSSGTLTMTGCSIRGNTASAYGGGVVNIQDATLIMTRCSITDNTAAQNGGGLYNSNGGPSLTMTNCTVSGNSAGARAGALYTSSTVAMAMTNSIVWGNDASENPDLYRESGPVSVSYSDLRGGIPVGVTDGGGNIDADPLFVNAAEGNYHIRRGSPCKDAGDPASPPDPDGSTVDMGAFPLQGEMVLPHVSAQPGSMVDVTVRGTVKTAYSAEVVFTVDRNIAFPDTPFVIGHAFAGKQSVQVISNVVGDTVFVAMSAAEPITLDDQMLVDLRFKVNPQAPVGDTALLVWVPWLTFYNDTPVSSLVSGWLKSGTIRGDVTGDGTLTGMDASWILQYVVRLRAEIDAYAADVTCNGRVSAFDAAWILVKVLHDEWVFPCDGGAPLPGTKPAPGVPLALSWVRDGSGWALRADYGALLAGDLVLSLGNEAPVTVSGGDHLAFRQEGSTLRVAFVSLEGDEPVLLRFAGEALTDVPRITFAQFNEGEVGYTLARPSEFALEQNVPNPFNPETVIRFSLPEAVTVWLVIYDVNGRVVRVLVDGTLDAGTHEAVWDGRDAAGRDASSGVYLYRLTSEHGNIVRRMTLLR